MSGFIVAMDSKGICAHGGQVQATTPEAKVLLSGQPAVTQGGAFVISGCPNPPPPSNVGPCASATWVKAATKVTIGGRPALLMDSSAVCAPTGASVTEISVQAKVSGM